MADTPAARRVLVTGGGRGLGSAIVRMLAAAGHDVTFTYRSASAEADALVKELTAAYPGRAFASHQADLADKAAVNALVATIEKEAPYSAFVHNAGQSYDTLAVMLDQEKAEAAMQVNFWSFTRLAAGLVRTMMRARDGRIVAIGSVTAERGNQGNAAYAASKAALLGYTRTLAVESASRGITVNYVAPGFVDTDMLAKYGKYRESMEGQIPAKRFAKPDDVAGIVAFLLTPHASYITGAYLPVDGGLTAAIGIHRS
jgi:3-oxoacyl-[acyl-carrier protein] reductase